MMITGAGAVLLKESMNCGGLQIIEYLRLGVEQHSFHLLRLLGAEPFIHNIHGKAALLAPENCSRQESLADFAVQPFARRHSAP